MGKHTPGPWNLVAGRTFETSSGTFSLSYGLKRNGEPRFNDPSELDANARLIAAAPELLEACKRAIEYFKAYSVIDHGNPDLGKVWGMLDYAIRKATEE